MSPSLKNIDPNDRIKLTKNCIVIVLTKINRNVSLNYVSRKDEELENVRSHSWPDNNNRPISPAALSVNSSGPVPYLPISSPSSPLKCTCEDTDGRTLFNQFVHVNSTCVWNAYLVDSVAKLDFKGFLVPSTLLISGTEFSLEIIRSAWTKRILKAPQDYQIEFIGDVPSIESKRVLQGHFTPLAEALCKCINELNFQKINATFEIIIDRLNTEFPNMELPSAEIVKNSLKMLIEDKKLYYISQRNSFICPSPDDFGNSSDDSRALSSANRRLISDEELCLRFHRNSTISGESFSNGRSLGVQTNSDTLMSGVSLAFAALNPSSMTWGNENTLENNGRTKINSQLRRCNSLRIEGNKSNGVKENGYTFNRSRSLKMSRHKRDVNPQDMDSDEVSKHKEEPYKRKSMFSKLLRIGNNGSSTKAKSHHLKHENFSCQFPEVNGKLALKCTCKPTIILESKGTQTIKSGNEIAALIIKQASKHALSKCSHNNNSDYPCKNRIYCTYDHCSCVWTNSKYTKQIKYKRTPQEECYVCCCCSYTDNCCRITECYCMSSRCSQRFANGKDDRQLQCTVSDRLINSHNYMSRKALPLNKNRVLPIDKELVPTNLEFDRKTSHNFNGQSIHKMRKSLNSTIDRGNRTSPLEPTIAESPDNKYIKGKHFQWNIMHDHPLAENVSKHPKVSDKKDHQSNNNNNNNNNIIFDNSVNVQIEIGSSSSINATHYSDPSLEDAANANNQLNINELSPTSFIASAPFSSNIKTASYKPHAQMTQQSATNQSILTHATTVSTTMTLPNGHTIGSECICNESARNGEVNEVNSMKTGKSNNNGNNSLNKQNNLFNTDVRINSVPHLSPIRQKLAKAKAEFFNSTSTSTCPKSAINNNMLKNRAKLVE